MKFKSTIITAMFASAVASNAATVFITNAANGGGDPMNSVPADTLYALKDNTPMSGGIVTVGYFAANVTTADFDTIEELVPLLGTFTVITSISPGTTPNNTFGTGPLPGYADQFDIVDPTQIAGTPSGLINSGNSLFNRELFAIITDAADLGSATLTSQFGVFFAGKLTGDTPVELGFFVTPDAGQGAIIGSFDTLQGDFAGDSSDPTSVFNTFKLDAIPEPSSALLGALGALALLRRRRN